MRKDAVERRIGDAIERRRGDAIERRRGHATGKRISVSTADFDMFEKEMLSGLIFETEHMENDGHLDKVIRKPWGQEYRIYADYFLDIWKLHIYPAQATSLHCHPRKETLLLCLGGAGEVHFLDQMHKVAASEYVYIDRGVFHSTKNTGSDDLHLIEIEMPRNKLDLVRAQDSYGRAGAKYEREYLSTDSPQIEPTDSVYGGKIRSGDCTGQYQFRVLTGRELAAVGSSHRTYAIVLGARHAMSQNIQVLMPEQTANHKSHDSQQYFTIIARH